MGFEMETNHCRLSAVLSAFAIANALELGLEVNEVIECILNAAEKKGVKVPKSHERAVIDELRNARDILNCQISFLEDKADKESGAAYWTIS